jgi:hypothetical protein
MVNVYLAYWFFWIVSGNEDPVFGRQKLIGVQASYTAFQIGRQYPFGFISVMNIVILDKS